MVALDATVREALRDWLPVSEAAHITLSCQSLAPCPVWFEEQRLRQAVFHLLEFVLLSAAGGATVKVDLAQQEGAALLRIATSRMDLSAGVEPVSADPAESKMEQVQRKLGLAITRSIFEAAGGSLEVTGGKELRVEIRLTLAEAPAEAKRSCGRGCAVQG